MRRNAIRLATSLVVMQALIGCSKKNKGIEQSAFDDAGSYNSQAALTAPTEAYPTYGSPAPVEPSTLALTASAAEPATTTSGIESSTGMRYHTVVRHDTLFGLARQYYGDASRWKDIYQANAGTISDPNRIHVGQKLVIP